MAPPSIYSDELVDEICARIMCGESLQDICKTPGMPTERAFYKWLAQDKQGLVQKYSRARKIQVEYYTDEIVPIADAVANSTDAAEVAAARLQIDTRKWLAAKRLPKVYGDKVAVTGANDAPLIPSTQDSGRLAQVLAVLGQTKALPGPGQVIDHDPQEDSGPQD